MDPYIGQILLVGFGFAPVGWAICDGRLLQIADFSALFNLIGTAYGGDGVSTFALPDLRGRTPVGLGNSSGNQAYVIGAIGGVESVTIIPETYPSHSHTVYATGDVADTASPANAVLGGGESIYASAAALNVAMNSAVCGRSTGSSGPHENRQPYLTMNWIIALEGVYPSPP